MVATLLAAAGVVESFALMNLCAGLLVCEGAVGVWGFVLHAAGNLRGPSAHAFQDFINGAPPFAPLLFPNLFGAGNDRAVATGRTVRARRALTSLSKNLLWAKRPGRRPLVLV